MDNVTASERKMIVFQLEDEEYAVPVNQIGSIEKSLPITRVPRTAPYVKGVINLRGVVIPIIDLRLRFSMKETDLKESTRIIIAQVEDKEVGLVVDAANDVIDIPEIEIEPAPEVIESVVADYITGVAKVDNRLFILLDLYKVLSLDESDDITTLEG